MKEYRDIKLHYISTTENPADIASRGASARELQPNRLWWHGPRLDGEDKRGLASVEMRGKVSKGEISHGI